MWLVPGLTMLECAWTRSTWVSTIRKYSPSGRILLRTLAEQRKGRKLSQTRVAAAMHTSQPTLARLETTAADTKLSKRRTGVVVET